MLLLAVGCGSAATPNLAPVERGLARLARNGSLSGVVLIAKDAKPIFVHAYGDAQKNPRVPNQVSTRFNLASLGKMFTAVAVAQLVVAGKLRFDDKVGRYVHGLPSSIGEQVTIAELLDHSSGLSDLFEHGGYAEAQPHLTSLAAYLPFIADDAPDFRPGSRY